MTLNALRLLLLEVEGCDLLVMTLSAEARGCNLISRLSRLFSLGRCFHVACLFGSVMGSLVNLSLLMVEYSLSLFNLILSFSSSFLAICNSPLTDSTKSAAYLLALLLALSSSLSFSISCNFSGFSSFLILSCILCILSLSLDSYPPASSTA